MIKHRKILSFLTSLLICASVVTAPAASVYADTEEPGTVTEEEDKTIYSGSFGYELLEDGTAQLTKCTLSDEVIEIPETIDGIAVTSIGTSAFVDASETVKKIVIPASVTDIAESTPFIFLERLAGIEVAEGNTAYTAVDGVLFTKDMTSLLCYPRGKSGDSYSIPEGVQYLRYASMSGTSLKEVAMPSSLIQIGSFALSYCTSLQKVDMSGSSVTTIISEAFEGCTALNEVLLTDTLTEIGGAAFWNCSSLTTITLPESLETIEQYAFAGVPIQRIRIPSSVTYIGYYALGYLSEEETVENFTLIGESGSYAEIYATETDDEYEYANNFIFMTDAQAAELDAYEALDTKMCGEYEYTVIDGGAAITGCLSMDTVIEIPSELDGLPVTRIYTAAFSAMSCYEIVVPDSVKTIDKLAFYGCSLLEKITINGAETIGESSFDECTALKSINIGGSCQSIEGAEPFVYCYALEEINIIGSGGAYSSEDGVLYNSDKSVLIAYPAAKTDKKFKAPKSVKEISQSAFYDAVNLENVDISSVETIGPYAFENCIKLSKVKLSKDLRTVGHMAFFGCSELKGVRLYDKLETIGDYAFGFYYDASLYSDEDEEAAYAAQDGFKLYVVKDSLAHQYAQAYGIEAVTNTIPLFGYNVVVGFAIFIGAAIAAAIGAVIAALTARNLKRKKAEKEREEAKARAAAKRREKLNKEKEKENDKKS